MKNIYIIPTDKPSSIFKGLDNKLNIGNVQLSTHPKIINQHLYITSDEEIKEGDWMIRPNEQPIKVTKDFFWDFGVRYYKIILTTDPDLIADGVQAIDDEFLEWFVKNPTCESVEVENRVVGTGFTHVGKTPSKQERLRGCYDNGEQIVGKWEDCYKYKIIIPKEEPICFYNTAKSCENSECRVLDKCNGEFVSKQETLEEAAEEYRLSLKAGVKNSFECKKAFVKGAKWQAERMYSEEEVIRIAFSAMDYKNDNVIPFTEKLRWFERFKKK